MDAASRRFFWDLYMVLLLLLVVKILKRYSHDERSLRVCCPEFNGILSI